MPLTDTTIKNSKPKDKPYKMADGRGLYIEITPQGSKRWRFRYRFERKQKLLSLGIWKDVSLKKARKERERLRELLADGVDPSSERKALKASIIEKNANSFETVAQEWLARHIPTWSKSGAEKNVRLFERDIFPWIGKMPISDITSPVLLKVLRRIEDRGAVDTAHRALGCCNRIFRYAASSGKIANDPCPNLRGALKPVKPGHFATITEPKELGRILRMIDSYRGNLPVRCALKLAPLVFVRPGELRLAKWKDIDFESAQWRYTVTKTKTEHIVPLAKQSLAILQEIRPLTGEGTYVFRGARGGERPMSDNALLVALRSMEIRKEELTIHGLRATARTILDEVLGFRPDHIEHQLAHAVRDPNGRAYNRTAHLEARTAMMQRWGDYLDELKGERGDSGNV